VTRARSILLAALIVCSAIVGTVGPALAQTTDTGPVQYEFTGSPGTVAVDVSAIDDGTDFTVEFTTMEGPDSPTVLYRDSHNTANVNDDLLLLHNEGAYDTLNVTVSEFSGGEPKFDTKSVAHGLTFQGTSVGSTGGDEDTQCTTADQIGAMVGGFTNLDCTVQPGTTTVNTTGTDASQTKLDIYQSAQNSKAQATNYHNTLDNYLADTKTQARIIGKNAYIRALNNGSSKSAAKTQAKDAVKNYYAVKQRNLASEWETQATEFDYLNGISESESGVSNDYVDFDYTENHDNYAKEYRGTTTETLTLANGETVETTGLKFYSEGSDTSGTDMTTVADPTTGTVSVDHVPGSTQYETHADFTGLHIKSHDGTAPRVQYMVFSNYSQRWNNIESQSQTVVNDMDTLAENTYSAYQQGEINNSDLVDPYVLANQQSAGEDFQGWTAAQLTLMGQNSPKNFDQIGSFNVTTESGTQYEGVLFSQENPASGQFKNGSTYNPSQIGGTQYVGTSDRIVELQSNFTINRITTTNGETTENVTIQKTTYKTTNVTELKQQYEDLAYRRAQIEAREKAMKQSAGGGLLGAGSVPPVVALAVIGTLLGIVVLQN